MEEPIEDQRSALDRAPQSAGHTRAGAEEQSGRSGQMGVSDQRRAQLSQMEQEAGVQHEAADESVPQQTHLRHGKADDIASGSGMAGSKPGA